MNGIWVEFPNRKTFEYVQKVCRRKGINLADYIIGNFEWDDMPDCIRDSRAPSKHMCYECEYNNRCEDQKAYSEHEQGGSSG